MLLSARRPQGLGRDDHHVAFRIEREPQRLRTTKRQPGALLTAVQFDGDVQGVTGPEGKTYIIMTLYRSGVGVWNALKTQSSACGRSWAE